MKVYVIVGSSEHWEWQEVWIQSIQMDEDRANALCADMNIISSKYKSMPNTGGTGALRGDLFHQLQDLDSKAEDCGFGIR